MNRFKANQTLLFKAETLFNLRPLEKYKILFSYLDTWPTLCREFFCLFVRCWK